jgi:hypothetical protein
MISVLLYGRNDNYGYNLHKRAALSLNCMAEVLTDSTDELIFVDYNTPDDFPTFPEAIQDTLSTKARRLLRILRVRPRHHHKFSAETTLSALESIARNVALRRSRADNRWILSTNTDMIFVPRCGRSLSEVAEHLLDGYYHLPRFDVPESLWESLNRGDAQRAIAKIADWGWRFHLNEIVYASNPAVRYDGPGDFQLMLRADLFRIQGFDERMLLGWHVDSNVARRLYLQHGKVGDILDDYYGYHCDHTRQATPAHRPNGVQNSVATFVDAVVTPFLSDQESVWGLADEVIEEFQLETRSTVYLSALGTAISSNQIAPSIVHYSSSTYDQIDYSTPHVLPFLIDVLVSYPRSTKIGWFSARPDLLQSFIAAWTMIGGTLPILVSDACHWRELGGPPGCAWASHAEIARQADVFVFDWGLPASSKSESWQFQNDPAIREVIAGFRAIVHAEITRLKSVAELPRRFIGINAINNQCETLFQTYIGATRSPLSSRLRQGFLIRQSGTTRELVPLLDIGGAGRREADGIAARAGMAGCVCYGPYLDLPPSWYRLHLDFRTGETDSELPATVALEVVAGSHSIWRQVLAATDLAAGKASFLFELSEELFGAIPVLAVEFRLHTDGRVPIMLTSITLVDVPAPSASDIERVRERARTRELLMLMSLGDAGIRKADGISATAGVAGCICGGPFLDLPPGWYRLHLRFKAGDTTAPRVGIEVLCGPYLTWFQAIAPADLAGGETSFLFQVPDNLSDLTGSSSVEFRLRTDGSAALTVASIALSDAPAATLDVSMFDWLPMLKIGPGGMLLPGCAPSFKSTSVHSRPGVSSYLVYGPYVALRPGRYRAVFALDIFADSKAPREAPIKVEAVANVGHRYLATKPVNPRGTGQLEVALFFEMPADDELETEISDLEFRIWSSGWLKFALLSLYVFPVDGEADVAPGVSSTATSDLQRSGQRRRWKWWRG